MHVTKCSTRPIDQPRADELYPTGRYGDVAKNNTWSLNPRRHDKEEFQGMCKGFQEDFEADMPTLSPGQSVSLTPFAGEVAYSKATISMSGYWDDLYTDYFL
jgi:hypothetical protein